MATVAREYAVRIPDGGGRVEIRMPQSAQVLHVRANDRATLLVFVVVDPDRPTVTRAFELIPVRGVIADGRLDGCCYVGTVDGPWVRPAPWLHVFLVPEPLLGVVP